MHVVPKLITAVNQTRQYVKANRVKLLDLQAHQAEIQKYIGIVRMEEFSYRARIHALETRQEMDRVL